MIIAGWLVRCGRGKHSRNENAGACELNLRMAEDGLRILEQEMREGEAEVRTVLAAVDKRVNWNLDVVDLAFGVILDNGGQQAGRRQHWLPVILFAFASSILRDNLSFIHSMVHRDRYLGWEFGH